jgi:hypothetical protein
MSYSRRQLEALGEPLGDSVTYKKLGGGYVAGFGGDSAPAPSSAPSSQNVTQTSIPEYAQPYVERMLGKTEALTDKPYQQYGGERVAGFTPLQQQAQSDIAGMQTAPQLGQATGMAGTAGIGGLMAGQNYQNMATNPYAMQSYMSPYQQNVTDFQKQQAVMDYGRQLPGLSAAAIGKGAFGGSRQAIVESEAQRNLQNQLAGIQATGSQNAFQNAQQAQQFGANLGLQGLQLGGQQAATLGQLGQTQYGQQMGINTAQQQAGAQQQALNQQNLTNQYQDFQNQQRYPYQQLGFMSDMVRGMPLTQQTQSIYQAPPSMTSQSIGLLGGLGSLAGAYASANR